MAKFKPESITNITVDADYTHSYSASWQQDGARFHVWFKPLDFKLTKGYSGGDGMIYKNPLATNLKTTDPDYFNTRQLDPDKPRNVEILAHVFAEIKRLDLVAKAEQARKDHHAAVAAGNAEAHRQRRIQCAGPAMLQVLRTLIYGDGSTEEFQLCIDLSREILGELGETREHDAPIDLANVTRLQLRREVCRIIAANSEH